MALVPPDVIADHVCPMLWLSDLVSTCSTCRELRSRLPALAGGSLVQYGIAGGRRPLKLLKRLFAQLRHTQYTVDRVHAFFGDFVTIDTAGRCRNSHGVVTNIFRGYQDSCVADSGDIIVASFSGTYSLLRQGLVGPPAVAVAPCRRPSAVSAVGFDRIMRTIDVRDMRNEAVVVVHRFHNIVALDGGELTVVQTCERQCMALQTGVILRVHHAILWIIGPIKRHFVVVTAAGVSYAYDRQCRLVKSTRKINTSGARRPLVVGNFVDGIHFDLL